MKRVASETNDIAVKRQHKQDKSITATIHHPDGTITVENCNLIPSRMTVQELIDSLFSKVYTNDWLPHYHTDGTVTIFNRDGLALERVTGQEFADRLSSHVPANNGLQSNTISCVNISDELTFDNTIQVLTQQSPLDNAIPAITGRYIRTEQCTRSNEYTRVGHYTSSDGYECAGQYTRSDGHTLPRNAGFGYPNVHVDLSMMRYSGVDDDELAYFGLSNMSQD